MAQTHTIQITLKGPFDGPPPRDEFIFRKKEEFIEIADVDFGSQEDSDDIPTTGVWPGDQVVFEIAQRVNVVAEGTWLPLFKEVLFFHEKKDYDDLIFSGEGIQKIMDYDFEKDHFIFSSLDNYKKNKNKVTASYLCLNASLKFTVEVDAVPGTMIYYLVRFAVVERKKGFFPVVVSHFNIDPRVKVKPQDLEKAPQDSNAKETEGAPS